MDIDTIIMTKQLTDTYMEIILSCNETELIEVIKKRIQDVCYENRKVLPLLKSSQMQDFIHKFSCPYVVMYLILRHGTFLIRQFGDVYSFIPDETDSFLYFIENYLSYFSDDEFKTAAKKDKQLQRKLVRKYLRKHCDSDPELNDSKYLSSHYVNSDSAVKIGDSLYESERSVYYHLNNEIDSFLSQCPEINWYKPNIEEYHRRIHLEATMILYQITKPLKAPKMEYSFEL